MCVPKGWDLFFLVLCASLPRDNIFPLLGSRCAKCTRWSSIRKQHSGEKLSHTHTHGSKGLLMSSFSVIFEHESCALRKWRKSIENQRQALCSTVPPMAFACRRSPAPPWEEYEVESTTYFVELFIAQSVPLWINIITLLLTTLAVLWKKKNAISPGSFLRISEFPEKVTK